MPDIQQPPKLLNPDPRFEQWLYRLYLSLGASSTVSLTALSDAVLANTGLIANANYNGTTSTNSTPAPAGYMESRSSSTGDESALTLHWMEA